MLFSSNKTNKNSSSSSSFLGDLFQSFSDAKEYASSMKRKLAASKGTEDEAYYSKKLATAEQNAKSLEEQITALKTDAAQTTAPASAASTPATADDTTAQAAIVSDATAYIPAHAASGVAAAANVVGGSAVGSTSAVATVSASAEAVAVQTVESPVAAVASAWGNVEAVAADVANDYQAITAAEAIQGFAAASVAHADVAVEALDTTVDENSIDELAINLADSYGAASVAVTADTSNESDAVLSADALKEIEGDEAYEAQYSNDLSDAVEALAALSLAEMENEVANSASYESVSDEEIAEEPAEYTDLEDSAAPPNEEWVAQETETADDDVAADDFADEANDVVEDDMTSLEDMLSEQDIDLSDEDAGFVANEDDCTDSADFEDEDLALYDIAESNEDVDEDSDAAESNIVEAEADKDQEAEHDQTAAVAENVSMTMDDEDAVAADEAVEADAAGVENNTADAVDTATISNAEDVSVESEATASVAEASATDATTAVVDADDAADATGSESSTKDVATAADVTVAADADAEAVDAKAKTHAAASPVEADTAESVVGLSEDSVAGAAVAVAKEVANTKKLAAAAKALERGKAQEEDRTEAAADGANGEATDAKEADADKAGNACGGAKSKKRAKVTNSKRKLKDLAEMRIEGDSVYLKDSESHFAQMRMKLRKALATAIEEAGEHLPEWFELSCTMMLLFGGLGVQEVEYTTRVMLAAAWRRRQTSSGVRSCAMRKEFMDDLSAVVDIHRMAIRASDSIISKERRELHDRCYDYIHSDDFIGKSAFEDMCHELSTEFTHLSEREIVLRCRLQWYQGLVDFAKVNADHKAVVAQYDKRLIASKIEIRPTMAAYAFTESYDTANDADAAAAGAVASVEADVAGEEAQGVAVSSAVIDEASAKYQKAARKYILAGKLHFVPSAQEVFEVCTGVAPILADAEKQYIAEVLCNRYEAQVLDKRNARMRSGDMTSLRNAIKRFKQLTEERDAVANSLQAFLLSMGTIIKSMKASKARNIMASSGSCAAAMGLAADKGELLDSSLVSAFDLEREALNRDAQDLLDAASEHLDGFGSSFGAEEDLASSGNADSVESGIAADAVDASSASASLAATDLASATAGSVAFISFDDKEGSADSITDDYGASVEAEASDYIDPLGSLGEAMGGSAASAAQDGDAGSNTGGLVSQDGYSTAGFDEGSSVELTQAHDLSSTNGAVGDAQATAFASDAAAAATVAAATDVAGGCGVDAVGTGVLADSQEHGDAYSADTETSDLASVSLSQYAAMEQTGVASGVDLAASSSEDAKLAHTAGAVQVAAGSAVEEESADEPDSVSNEGGQASSACSVGQGTTTTAKNSNSSRVLASAAKDAPEGCQISLEAGDQMIMGPSYKRRKYDKAQSGYKQGEGAATSASSASVIGGALAIDGANASVGGMSLGQSLSTGAKGSAQYGDIEDVFTSDRGCDMDTSVILHKQDKSVVAANDAIASNGGCAGASALNAAFGHAALDAAEESGLVDDVQSGLASAAYGGNAGFMADMADKAVGSVEAADVGADDAHDGIGEDTVSDDAVAVGVAKSFKAHAKAKAKAKAKNKGWKHRKAHQSIGGDAHAPHRSNLSQSLAQATALGGVCQSANLAQALGMFQEPSKAISASLPLTEEYLAKPQNAYEHGSTSVGHSTND